MKTPMALRMKSSETLRCRPSVVVSLLASLSLVISQGGCSGASSQGARSTQTHRAVHVTGVGTHQHGGGQDSEHHGSHRFADADEWARVFDDPARDAWQRPDMVLGAMALEPAMVVADIGAGTGYFSVRLARAVPQGEVIATDIETGMVRHLTERARREGISNLRAVLSQAGDPGLGAQSVDRVLIVDVWHHLGDRVAYARALATALRPRGRIYVVDFRSSAQHGPPAHMRLEPEVIVSELTAAGLRARVLPVELPDQYVIEARRESE